MSEITLIDFLKLYTACDCKFNISSFTHHFFKNTDYDDLSGDKFDQLCDRKVIGFAPIYSFNNVQLLICIEAREGDDEICLYKK